MPDSHFCTQALGWENGKLVAAVHDRNFLNGKFRKDCYLPDPMIKLRQNGEWKMDQAGKQSAAICFAG